MKCETAPTSPPEDEADDEAEREDTEEAAGVGRCGAAGRQAPRDLLDIAEPGADDPHCSTGKP
jgi:hypothetical protein